MKRAKLPPAQYEALLVRQGYACATWGCVNKEPYEADHVLPICLGGTNEAFNWQLLCKPCHKAKSALDVKAKAKGDRQGGRTGQWALRKKNGPQLKGRGFQGWRDFAGNIIKRER